MNNLTRTLKGDEDKDKFKDWLDHQVAYPMTVSVVKGKEKRSSAQNRLQWRWLQDAERQGDNTAEEYRAFCKLHLGVPILLQDEDFRISYNEVFRPLEYERKLRLMSPPFDFPVTRLMSVKQKTKYLDKMFTFFTGKGFLLTDPQILGIEGFSYSQ